MSEPEKGGADGYSSGSKRKRKEKVKKKHQLAAPRFLVDPSLLKEKIGVTVSCSFCQPLKSLYS